MPLVELDVLMAFLDSSDPGHEEASRVVELAASGKADVLLSPACLIEISLLYRTLGMDAELESDLRLLLSIFRGRVGPLGPVEALRAARIRREHGLTFFDSFHAASALSLPDQSIVSFDRAYDRVAGLRRIDPADFA